LLRKPAAVTLRIRKMKFRNNPFCSIELIYSREAVINNWACKNLVKTPRFNGHTLYYCRLKQYA
jgi:hypothetical protein